MEEDKLFLGRAVGLASESIAKGGGPFGAVIVKNKMIISEAHNTVFLSNDPTAHAEVSAIRKAAEALGSFDLTGCSLYTSCEPCPMCLGAIYWAGIRKVVYASDRKDAEEAGFSDNLIYEEISRSPSERTIEFKRMEDSGSREVFRRWIALENKNPY
jgi:guanine deaminase